ncbi:MAG TPA: class I SAM-dependent methyltransferase [Acidiferrobacteraceae bacterium]|nr:class I SAM-dependent methyltransferase [Acidiferrobacteraceae bacterium]
MESLEMGTGFSADIFDSQHYIEINEARWDAAERVVEALSAGGELSTCYDVGCGPGWFAEKLVGLGIDVTGIEARSELVDKARKRVPGATFVQCDLDVPLLSRHLSAADFVFCFGLLYHLENPFRAIRNLYQLTRHYCLVESIMIPGDSPQYCLVQESSNVNQGMTHCALIPSLAAMTKMLYAAGFSHVYRCRLPVEHPDFVETDVVYQRRSILLAAHGRVELEFLEQLAVPQAPKYSFLKNVC